MKKVELPRDIPQGRHFQILTFSEYTVHHEGDERSRANPGHGYPAYDETIRQISIQVTTDEEEFKRELKKLYEKQPHRTDIVGIEVNRSVEAKLNITVEL